MTLPPPKRRWYQFSLRMMLLAMIVASAAFGYWVHWSKEWIRQRREVLLGASHVNQSSGGVKRNAPGGLWLWGEDGVGVILCSPGYIEQATQLFPEARIYPTAGNTVGVFWVSAEVNSLHMIIRQIILSVIKGDKPSD